MKDEKYVKNYYIIFNHFFNNNSYMKVGKAQTIFFVVEDYFSVLNLFALYYSLRY